MVQAGKAGTIYLLDRDDMTLGNQHYCSGCVSDVEIVQEIPGAIGGLFSGPAYWNNTVYIWGVDDALVAYSLIDGRLGSPPASTSKTPLGYPGATPTISSSGVTNGIVWAIDSSHFGAPDEPAAGPAVLHAFDASDVANELYNTSLAPNGRDTAGNAVKFAVPTVANGKVYVGTQTELDVYGS